MRSLQHQVSRPILASCCALAGMIVGCTPSDRFVKPDPPRVTVSVPVKRSITEYDQFTGTTKAEETVELRARVKGFLKERLFVEKKPVKKGDLLFVIDEEPFQVALAMAKAKLAESNAAVAKAEQSKAREVAAATLALDQASLNLAMLDERRSRALLDRNAGTKEAYDQSEASRRKAEAQVAADQASLEQAMADFQSNILSARANAQAAQTDVRNAEINLGYCRIFAPFDGRISRRVYDVGNLVGDGTATLLATVYKDNPIYAYINLSDTDLLRFRQQAREGKRKDFQKGDEIALELQLENETGFPHKGVLDYADPEVNLSSGTVVARGVFPNPDGVILPGLFVKVRVARRELPDALLVPERALGTDQFGSFLLIVGKDKVVEKRTVKVGVENGTFRVIASGLRPEDLVVVNGLQKARDGMEVDPIRKDETLPVDSSVVKTP